MREHKETRPGFVVGARVVLEGWGDPGWPESPIDPTLDDIPPGTEGEIRSIDSIGTLHVRWETGHALGLIPGTDTYRLAVVTEEDMAYVRKSLEDT